MFGRPASFVRSCANNPASAAPLLLFATVLIFGPANLYLSNKSEFFIVLHESLCLTIPAALLLAGLCSAGLLLLPERLRRLATALLVALSLLLWLQGNVMVWSYGPLDGRAIQWSDTWQFGVVDSTVWVTVLALALALSRPICRATGTITALLLTIQSLSLSITAWQTRESSVDSFKHFHVQRAPAFDFSIGRNVLLMVVDEFQSDVLADLLSETPEYTETFDGFVYYRNALAGASFTELAIPAILTGRLYDNTVPRSLFLRDAFLRGSLPKMLTDRGFEVHLFPWRFSAHPALYYDEGLASNWERRGLDGPTWMVDTAKLLDVALFRYVPHFVKPFVYNDQRWLWSRGVNKCIWELAHNEGTRGSSATDTTPRELGPRKSLDDDLIRLARGAVTLRRTYMNDVFKLYHLSGLHIPLTMSSDFERGNKEYNRSNYLDQARAYLNICGALFAALKRVGLYDDSLILVVGDHGSGRSNDMELFPGHTRRRELDGTAAYGNFQTDKARGAPVVLVKRFRARGGLEVSDAPVSLIDVPSTIMRELELPVPTTPALSFAPDFRGTPMLEIEEDAARTRYYAAYRWERLKSDFVPTITLYRLEGHTWSDQSWHWVATLRPGGRKAER